MNWKPNGKSAPFLLRLWRLAALAGAAWLLRHPAAVRDFTGGRDQTDPAGLTANLNPENGLTLEAARSFFPAAAELTGGGAAVDGAMSVLAADGSRLGTLLKTSPQAGDIIGYSGPSDLLVALDNQERIAGAELLASGDTPAHAEAVRRSAGFWQSLNGWRPAQEAAPAEIDAVSGSTLTSLALVETVSRRLGRGAGPGSLRFPDPLTLNAVRRLFPDAVSFTAETERPGWFSVSGNTGEVSGFVVRTSPFSDHGRGFQGPSETLASVSPDRLMVTGMTLLKSYDTPDYADRVREDQATLEYMARRPVSDWTALDFEKAGIEGVSGATQTSHAMAEGLRWKFAADARAAEKKKKTWPGVRAADWALGILTLGAVIISSTGLRGRRWLRIVWQAGLIAGFGLWFGQMLSLSLLTGWAAHGLPWKTAPGLMALAVAALVVPWAGRRQVYCHHLCPHGAAQEWLGRWKRLHVRVPARWHRRLSRVPGALLGGLLLLTAAGWRGDLSKWEPFDGWVLKWAAPVSAGLALLGLAASVFVPQAYCRYGCPTGAVLRFARSRGSADRFGPADWAALALLVAGGAVALGNGSD
ncbi:MAG: FMN-binding protein [Verrucomicrobiota bacterium]